jgi:PhzF family phenazine biosynthesis protein
MEKMKLKLYQVDAFTDKLFHGNPAGVCPLSEWLPDETMQNIASENNLAETAFFVKEENDYRIRWFTPKVEVDLCGHATLATGHVLFNHLNFKDSLIIFNSRSGILKVRRENEMIVMDFPKDSFIDVPAPLELTRGLGKEPIQLFKGRDDYMAVYQSEDDILNLKPDMEILCRIKSRGIIVTAKGKESDFVSRFFAPQVGINEDPVTGSAHTSLAPYWANVYMKDELTAIQLSSRKGWLKCKVTDTRVEIAGKAVTYMEGEIEV